MFGDPFRAVSWPSVPRGPGERVSCCGWGRWMPWVSDESSGRSCCSGQRALADRVAWVCWGLSRVVGPRRIAVDRLLLRRVCQSCCVCLDAVWVGACVFGGVLSSWRNDPFRQAAALCPEDVPALESASSETDVMTPAVFLLGISMFCRPPSLQAVHHFPCPYGIVT